MVNHMVDQPPPAVGTPSSPTRPSAQSWRHPCFCCRWARCSGSRRCAAGSEHGSWSECCSPKKVADACGGGIRPRNLKERAPWWGPINNCQCCKRWRTRPAALTTPTQQRRVPAGGSHRAAVASAMDFEMRKYTPAQPSARTPSGLDSAHTATPGPRCSQRWRLAQSHRAPGTTSQTNSCQVQGGSRGGGGVPHARALGVLRTHAR